MLCAGFNPKLALKWSSLLSTESVAEVNTNAAPVSYIICENFADTFNGVIFIVKKRRVVSYQ